VGSIRGEGWQLPCEQSRAGSLVIARRRPLSYHLRKYTHSPKYWYARVTRPDGTRTNWKSTRKERKGDAKLVAEQWDAAASSGNRVVTLAEAYKFLAAHMERKEDSDSTMEVLSLKASHVCSFMGEHRDIASIKLADTEAYLDMRRAAGRSDSTIAKELGYLIGALRRCKRLGMYDADPAVIWPEVLPKQFPGRKRWLTWSEYLKLIDVIVPQWRDHLIVYTSTGVRFSELYELTARSVRGGWLHVEGTKTDGANRKLPLSAEAAEALQRRVDGSSNGTLFPLASPDIDSQKRAWLRALAKACKRAGLEHASTNDLRRTFCSWAWHNGVDERVCVGWMGHRSSRMVREVYAQPSREHGEREAAKMPTRFLTPVSPQTPQQRPN
jgi:integrase